ncbi:MAG: type II toxin-antitoxin system MqsR family toxin [Syntrophales bacterium]|nr:type II toxin-antitoxin system MqsR family toxin [Syntrophales bacterium]
MEKRKPHYELKKIKDLFCCTETRVITTTARKGAVLMGYMDDEDIQHAINQLCSEHFYKSMTAYHDHRVWQDVYIYPAEEEKESLYVKLQLSVDGKKAVLIQMKKNEEKN